MTYDQGNDDVIVYNNVLMSVILHFNISTFNIFKPVGGINLMHT